MSDAFKKIWGNKKFLPSTEYWTAATLTKNCAWQGCFCNHLDIQGLSLDSGELLPIFLKIRYSVGYVQRRNSA